MHQQVRSWLFSEDELSPEQVQAMQAHLQVCESCRSFAAARDAVEAHLHSAPQRMPAMGFVHRWRERLELERKQMHQRQISRILVILSLSASFLLVPLAFWIYIALLSPQDLVINFAQGAVRWVAWLRFMLQTSLQVGESFVQTIPVGWWLAMATASLLLTILWVGSLYRFAFKHVERGVMR